MVLKMKVKKAFKTVIALVLVLSVVFTLPGMGRSAKADTLTESGYTYHVLENGTVCIDKYTGTATTVTVPQTLGGKTVKWIGPQAFAYTSVVSVRFLDGITGIDDYAFSYASNLNNITLPNSLTTLGGHVFSQCRSLTEVTVPANTVNIDYNAFVGCPNLTKIIVASGNPRFIAPNGVLIDNVDKILYTYPAGKTDASYSIPAGVEYIAGYAFTDSKFSTIYIPSTVIQFDSYSFYRCNNLKSITIPSSTTTVSCPFAVECMELESISVSGSNGYYKAIDGVLFDKAGKNLYKYPEAKAGDAYYVPVGVVYINEQAFSYNTNLVSVVCPTTLKRIEKNAFSHCSKLEKVVIDDGIEYIGNSAFYCSNGIKELYIPDSIKNIDSFAFSYMEGLETIFILSRSVSIGSNAFGYSNPVVYGYSPSTVSAYAEEYSLRFVDYDAYSKIERIYGDDRYGTSVEVAFLTEAVKKVPAFDSIVIASGQSFPDALAGSYLAVKKEAPIILYAEGKNGVVGDAIEAFIFDNLKDNGTIYVLGGNGAVPSSFEDRMGDDYNIVRLAGADRYETNLMILEEAGVGPEDDVLVCTGTDYADSLSASATGKPILLVPKNKLAKGTNYDQEQFLSSLGNGNNIYVIGGTGAVNDSVFDKLMNYGSRKATRIFGQNRFETSVAIARAFFEDPEFLVMAYGANFPDGLSGGPLAYALEAPLILSQNANVAVTAPKKYVNEIGSDLIDAVFVLGGPTLISDETISKILE